MAISTKRSAAPAGDADPLCPPPPTLQAAPSAVAPGRVMAVGRRYGPGLGVAALGVVGALIVHRLVGSVAMLTAAVALGVVAANTGILPGVAKAGLGFAGKRLMRVGVVLLGLQVSLSEIFALGWATVAMVLATVAATFFGTQWLGRRMGLSPRLSLLVATGFSICGASAVAAVNGALGSTDEKDDRDTVIAVALVTLCGSLAIVLLPPIGHLLGLAPADFGRWAGASVHDVGQVVATASVAGPAALAPAVAVKLIRVATLAPIVSGVALRQRRTGVDGKRPPLLPLFVAGFLVMIAVRTAGWLPPGVLSGAKTVQDIAFAAALFGLGSAVRLRDLARTGRKALLLGLASWFLIAAVSYAGILLTR